MPLQFSDALRNNRINQFETTIGTSPTLQIRSGPPPVNCAAIDTGTLLCSMVLPSDWLAVAALGVKTKLGTWQANADPAAGAGTAAGYFRLKQGGTTVHCQGTVSVTGGGGHMTIDNIMIVAGQPVSVTSFTITDGNQ